MRQRKIDVKKKGITRCGLWDKKRVLICGLLIAMGFCLPAGSFAAQEEKVIISYSSRDFSILPAQIAITKGFFREEGLDPIMVQMRPPVAGPALMNGEIHYTSTFGSMLNAIMQGMPARLLAVMTEKPPYYIIARPGINSVMDLRGKKIAAQQRGCPIVSPPKRSWNQKGSI